MTISNSSSYFDRQEYKVKRLKLKLAYDGTDFCGWQLQPGVRTVQGEVEKAIFRITGSPVRVHGSGRTDSGVHALAQTAHADIPESRLHVPWHKALNAILPEDISVLEAGYVPDSFHSRFSALEKTYTYTLWDNRQFLIPQRRHYVWSCGAVDFERMDRAAEYFIGQHDFSAFQNTGTPVKDTVRTIFEISRSLGDNPYEWVYLIRGDGFLKQMVRNMIGCLVEIGRGKAEPHFVRSLLAGKDRTKSPATAPPQGLCLFAVAYKEENCGSDQTGRDQSDTNGSEQQL